jgi:magnesium-transporting ATPase (P-type)
MGYLKALALCHTVTIDKQGDEEKYNAASPDELAFVEFTKGAGLVFKGIDSNEVVTLEDITVKGTCEERKYKRIGVCEFTSARRLSSCIY